MNQASDQGSHCLKICVHGAKGLMKQDIFGLSDPYLVVYQEVFERDQNIAEIHEQYRSAIQRKSFSPR